MIQTQASTHTPTHTTHFESANRRASLLRPAGVKDLSQRDLYREFLRWPTFLWLPASVAILVMVAMQSIAVAVPVAPLLATAATMHAIHRACARMNSRNSTAVVSAFVPKPRTGFGR